MNQDLSLKPSQFFVKKGVNPIKDIKCNRECIFPEDTKKIMLLYLILKTEKSI